MPHAWTDVAQTSLERLASAPVLLVASDFDGTLAPIVPRPQDAAGDPALLELLQSLSRLPRTWSAVLSGRALQDLAPRVERHAPDVLLVGSHGVEMDTRLGPHREGPAEKRTGAQLARQLRQELSAFPGIELEVKPSSVAVHVRGVAPEQKDEVILRARGVAQSVSAARVVAGLEVLEVMLEAGDKGVALRTLRFRTGASHVLFLGDDVTDEDAFASLTPGDVGVKVGNGPSAAAARVDRMNDVRKVLADLLAARRAHVERVRPVAIEQHSMLTDQRTLALVDARGSVVWMCAPRADSPALFASLLDGPGAGSWDVLPETPAGAMGPATQRYEKGTFVLRTQRGGVSITDWLDCSGGRPFQRAGRTDLVRTIASAPDQNSSAATARVRFAPRLDYGRAATTLEQREGGLAILGGIDPMVLSSPGVRWQLVREGNSTTAYATLDLSKGPITMELRCGTSQLGPARTPDEQRLQATRGHWSHWVSTLRPPATCKDLVLRSALVLRGLCHGPTGAFLAAGTTSLPEQLGGVRNWDYRYCWIRDAAWSAAALVRLSSSGHAMKYLDWLVGVLDDLDSPERLHPLYSVRGGTLGSEGELPHLDGYHASKPVRIGNGAATQVQLDVFGTVAELISLLAACGAPLPPDHLRVLDAMVAGVEARWHEPDHGIWEERDTPRHHVSSKVMCWFAVDRAIETQRLLGVAPRERDVELARAIREDVLSKGVHPTRGSFVSAYGQETLDAATLLTGLTGLVPANDARFVRTVEDVQRHLLRGPGVLRYIHDDGLPGIEGGFAICTGWLIESLILLGRLDEAQSLLERFASLAGPTGLLSEQHDAWGTSLGNYPQAYSHLALINAAVRLDAARAQTGKAGTTPLAGPCVE